MGPDWDGGLSAGVALLASALTGRRDELAEATADRIMAEVAVGRAPLVRHRLLDQCRAHIDAVLRLPRVPGPEQAGTVQAVAAAHGRAGAAEGIALAVLLDSYRVGFRVLWEAVEQVDLGEGPLDRDGLIRAASAMGSLHAAWAQSLTQAYHTAAEREIVARERERSALVGAVLDGPGRDAGELWDLVEALRLPHDSPYVVVAAEVLTAGPEEKIRVVENRLTRAGVPSAWRLLPDSHAGAAGIAAVRRAAHVDAVTEVLSAVWDHRVGISPRIDTLDRARRALRFAKLAMAAAPRGSGGVTVFGQAPVAVLAASAPDVMAEVAEAIWGSLNRLPDHERAVLVGTLRAWLACAGSTDAAAKVLFCHPNTVRYRLNKITELTGRSVTDPRAVTELSLAVQADSLTRLPDRPAPPARPVIPGKRRGSTRRQRTI